MRKLHALLLIALVTVGFGTIYAVAQQYGRSAANDAPIALAQRVAAQLQGGTQPADLPVSPEDMAKSYDPFFVVYDKNYQPVAGSGYLNGTLASPDSGVFGHAGEGRYHTVTWQPQPGVRIASVEAATGNYYVLAGQSLMLTERRATRLFNFAAMGWLFSVACIAVGYVLLRPRRVVKRKK